MIAITDGTISPTSRKWLDIEVTNRWPLITLGEKSRLLRADGSSEDLSGFDHLSIPPDLRLHLSGPADQIMFDAAPAWVAASGRSPAPFHWFTFIGKTIERADFLSGGKRRVWNGCVLISPFTDERFDPTRTRVFVDFFLHSVQFSNAEHAPMCLPGMRAAHDRQGCTLGPFLLGEIQRRAESSPSVLCTLRFGFVELDNRSGTFLYVPLSIHSQRSCAQR